MNELLDGGAHNSLPKSSSWPRFEDDEILAATAVLQSGKVNYWTGQECRLFEQEFADYLGTRHAIAVANGTAALELALEALGVGDGDEVITTPRTFIASASAAIRRGAYVVFADVDPESQNITAESISQVLSARTKAIVAVHLAGWPCDMDPIMELANSRGLSVVEDCAQAHGATYKGRPVGSLGHVSAFSFCQDKIMTTGGEGGMVVTNDDRLWERIWALKDHGKDFELSHEPVDGAVYRWLHASFGGNQRMTEMQAAIGRRQLRKLDRWVTARRDNAAILTRELQDVKGLRVPVPGSQVGHAYYKFYAFLETRDGYEGAYRDALIRRLRAAGVVCGPGSCSEIYLEKAFEHSTMRPRQRLYNARLLGETSLMFQVDPTLDARDMMKLGAAVKNAMSAIAA